MVYSLLEFVIFRNFLTFLPLRFQGYLHPVIRTLAQSSKKGVLPKDYIMIAGDSYAVGSGDWVMKVNDWTNPMYASHHLLHKMTGRDVISFGVRDKGSISALAEIPIDYYQYLNKTLLYKIAPPQIILVYFYEGNDLNNNLRDLAKKFEGVYDRNKIYDKEYFQRFVKKNFVTRADEYQEEESFKFRHNLFFLRMILRMAIENAEAFFAPTTQPLVNKTKRRKRRLIKEKANLAVIRNKKVLLPRHFQGPAMELTEEELKLGIYVFEQSLDSLRESFPGSTIKVVYIPSPLSTYQLASDRVSSQSYHKRGEFYPTEELRLRSDKIHQQIKEITVARNLDFIDARATIRKAAQTSFVHGAIDKDHFNKKGYEALAEAIAPYLH
jgi:hypothetical protein